MHSRQKHHGTRRVPAHAKCDSKIVAAQNPFRVPQSLRKNGCVAKKLCSADSLQTRHADCFERQPGLRHQPRFHSALGSYDHDASFSFGLAAKPFTRNGNRRENVPAGAAAGNQQTVCILLHISSACWLMFKSTPVANNIKIKLDPP